MDIKTLYRCGECREVHDDEDGARECCMPEVTEVYACPICGEIHDDEDGASACCGYDETPCPSCRRGFGTHSLNYHAIKVAGHCTVCNPLYTSSQQFAIEDLHWQATGRMARLNA